MANKKEVMVYPQSFSTGEKAIARQNIGAGTGNGNSDITRVDLSNVEYDVDKLSIYLRSTRNAEFRVGQTSLGSTVPTPSMASQEGKVPVAYYRDGNGYFLLEQYKDPRLPDSSSSNVNQVLTVDGHGVANWANPVNELPTPTHDKIAGGMCDVQNFERYDKILGLNDITNPLLPINTDTLNFEYFSYHAGSVLVTSKVNGQLLITGTRHNLTTDSIVNDRLSINTTLNLTSDVRTSLSGYGFSLSQQELERNDYRIDWDLIITFRPGSGSNFGSWWNPLRVKISRTPDMKIITG